jgi:glycosyltransferase involved in cell wall biosynthesis
MRLFGYDGTYVYNHYADILNKNGNFDVFKGLPIYSYPQFYNLMDCSLVPLEENNFNKYKSELKLIEAGFFKKAVIVSNVHPYKKVINKDNCLTVNNSTDWSRHCQRLIDNPSQAKDLGEALHESVKQYSIDIVNKKRYKFYQDVLKNLNINSRILSCGMEILN